MIGFIFILAVAGWWNDPAMEQYKFTLPMVLPSILGLFGMDAVAHYKKNE